jgi:hypothetical protein
MVSSRLDIEINYKENKKIEDEDKGYESSLYEIHIFGKNVVIAIGKPKYTYSKKKVIYYPIYIVSKENRIEGQIGVFEIKDDMALKVLDEEGDVDINRLGAPLYYSFAEKLVGITKSNVIEYLQLWEKPDLEKMKDNDNGVVDDDNDNSVGIGDDDKDDVFKLGKIDETYSSKGKNSANKILEKGIFIIDENARQPPTLPEETEGESTEIRKKYKERTAHNWVQKFMKNENYDIHEVESNGDCFFAVLRDAFKQIGYTTNVVKLRAILANEATEKIYQDYTQLYFNLTENVKASDKTMKDIKHTIENDLKKRAKSTTNKDEINRIIAEGNRLTEKYKDVREDKKETQKLIDEIYGNTFKDITSFEKFREYIQTSDYWADTWAISTLERVLNIKMIIFSEHDYNENNVDSVLHCGEVNPELSERGKFEPNHYIMCSYSGNHYRLISYKNKQILTFPEIPYDVKILIVNKCIERNAGIYYMIQDFRNFKSRLGIHPDIGNPTEDQELEEEIPEHELYNRDIVFMFHAKSDKSSKPGKGNGEKISKEKMAEFVPLSRIDNWRRKLDDSYIDAPFTIDSMQYASVIHYYQSAKFKKGNPDFAKLFTINNGSDISKDVALAKAAGSKTGKTKDIVLRPKNVVIDPDFYPTRNKEERYIALRAKFTENEEMKHTLSLTKDAKLVHYIARQPPEMDDAMMRVRATLKE